MQTKILIASPINQKPIILAYFLFGLHCLEKEGFQVDILFVDDNEDSASSELLTQYKEAADNVTIINKANQTNANYYRDNETHYWNDQLITKVAQFKDNIIAHALEHQYDGLLLVDSDIMIYPDTISRLWNSEKPIISNIFWTKWTQNSGEMPQVWMMDEYLFYQKNGNRSMGEQEIIQQTNDFLHRMRTPGIYEVGGLGACTLIRRSALEKGVSFKRIDNVSFWGEDRHFCIRAAALNIPLHVDTSEPAFHIYRESDLAGAEQYKKKILEYRRKLDKSTISLCMVVHNDEATLEKCLSSVAPLVDEIIIVDLGSTDRTTQIAASFTNHIFQYEHAFDYAAARNYSFSKATQKYWLWMNPNEVLLEDNVKMFQKLQSELTPSMDAIAFIVPHANEQTNDGPKTSHYFQNRLIKRNEHVVWTNAAHEYLTFPENFQAEKSYVTVTVENAEHKTGKYLPIYNKMISNNVPFQAEDYFNYANELKSSHQFAEAITQYERYLEQKEVQNSHKLQACYSLADCYQLTGDKSMQWYAIFHSFRLGMPQPEALCRIGAFLMTEELFEEAIFWFNNAVQVIAAAPVDPILPANSIYWTWLPSYQLANCHQELNQLDKALDYIKLTKPYQEKFAFLLEKQTQLEQLIQDSQPTDNQIVEENDDESTNT